MANPNLTVNSQANLLVLSRDDKMKQLAVDRERQVAASMKGVHEMWTKECDLVQECNLLQNRLDLHRKAYLQEVTALRERYRVAEEPTLQRITQFEREIAYLSSRRGIIERDIQRVNDLHAMKMVEVNRKHRKDMEDLRLGRNPPNRPQQANNELTQHPETPRQPTRNGVSRDKMNGPKNGRRQSRCKSTEITINLGHK
ncbi:hypothetical protein F4802DRAFT_591211 [Xylaria palmicola]|nr:hypothetical protein F4802DRAFT_591211 [Xylaria palmicola]